RSMPEDAKRISPTPSTNSMPMMSWRCRKTPKPSRGTCTSLYTMSQPAPWGPLASQCAATVEADHGRLDLRTYGIPSAIEWLGAMALGANLWSVGLVESRREVSDRVAVATRVSVTSLPDDVTQFAKAVREHWEGRSCTAVGAGCLGS